MVVARGHRHHLPARIQRRQFEVHLRQGLLSGHGVLGLGSRYSVHIVAQCGAVVSGGRGHAAAR